MQKKWVWLDLEMTGLDTEKHTIIEIATAITDTSLNLIEKGPDLIINASELQLSAMSDFVKNMHETNGLLEKVQSSTETIHSAESKTLAFLKKHLEPGQSPLCGNSVSYDRRFLEAQMPRLATFFHYRHIDVTTFKLAITQWYPHAKLYQKKLTHRAMDDVIESIEELKHYQQQLTWTGEHDHVDDR